ncbi:MAG: hypothetical protein E6K56_06530 [Ignavibacteria bacterium]|nr:MAG: hypothetical protein E6K56_06530 [Ignavibacteria bacterium]
MKVLIAICFLLLLGASGCEKKTEPVPVGEMNEYRDPGYGFKIHYPIEWKQLGTTGKAVFAKSQEVLNRLQDPRTGEPGGAVTVEVIRYQGKPFPDILQAAKDDMKQSNFQLNR